MHTHLKAHTLFNRGAARWFECYIPLVWLYERKHEKWIADLAVQLKVQGTDYEALFNDWPYEKGEPQGQWNYLTHVVNLAMCLKSEALYSLFMGKERGGFAYTALDILLQDHGMPAGHFNGGECLAGKSPAQGTELCGIVEAMYSYEWLFAISGDDYWANILESLAFNALPAAISAGMWSHQYVQMTNQVQCSRLEKSHFTTNHLFGLEPHYGCCTANFGQGRPKLALSGLLREKDGVAIGAIVPCRLDTNIKGVSVSIEITTAYPFEDGYTVIVDTSKPVDFSISLRIPSSASGARINGEKPRAGTNRGIISRVWQNRTEIRLEFNLQAELKPFDNGLYSC